MLLARFGFCWSATTKVFKALSVLQHHDPNIDFRWQCSNRVELYFALNVNWKTSKHFAIWHSKWSVIQFDFRFIDSTVQQQKFNLGQEKAEVEVKHTAKASSNWFLNNSEKFAFLRRIEGGIERGRGLTIWENVCQPSSSSHCECFESCHMSMSTERIENWLSAPHLLRIVVHATTNVNSLTSWQTINNWSRRD